MRKPLVKNLSSPAVPYGPSLTEFMRYTKRGWPTVDNAFAEPPRVIDAYVTSLLPKKGAEKRIRKVVWENSAPQLSRGGPSKEVIVVSKVPPKLGGLTTISAMIEAGSDYERLNYAFDGDELHDGWPDVTLSSPPSRSSRAFERRITFQEAAPAIGLLMGKLVLQADPAMVLQQETQNFVST